MWKARPENDKPMSFTPDQNSSTLAVPSAAIGSSSSKEPLKPASSYSERTDVGHIGKSVLIRGELTGNEDLYLDGEIEGTIDLRDHKLVIGPNGKIKAAISARELVVYGKVEGNVGGSERVELKKSSTLLGDINTQRIVIEDGAFFKGAVDMKESGQRRTMSAAASARSVGGHGDSHASGFQSSFSEPK